MNLIIDIGNNSAKYFIFHDTNIILRGRRTDGTFDFISEYAEQFHIKEVIVSSVVELTPQQKESIESCGAKIVWMNSDTPLPIKVDYRTPHTLGSDRLAAAVGAMAQAPGRDILVIDAGSAITIDFLDKNGTFRGGNISPGVKMRLKALHNFTSRLPLVEKEGETPYFGYDTESAIRSGVIYGICNEIEGYISTVKEKYPDVLVFLTGGDEKTLIDKIKTRIFADKFLVAKGLNKILENIC